MANRVEKALGHHGFWGYSAAFDVNELNKYIDENENESDEPLNILLVLPGDLRHLLMTVARRRRHQNKKSSPLRPLNFYVLETTLEVIARELLLLQVLLDFEIPIRQRANTFLEIFGNTLVQERTSKYIASVGRQLHELLNKKANAPDGSNASLFLENIIDLDCLKFREIDKLCGIFRNTYSNNIINNYKTRINASGTATAPASENYNNMIQLRDQRLRGFYAERYDSKHAASDWDFHYHFGKNIAKIIHIKIYREWRCGGTASLRPLREGQTAPPLTPAGVAFEFGDQVYTHNNVTMLSYVEGRVNKGQDKGVAKEILGFWGDIVGSPYFSFGIDSADPKPKSGEDVKKTLVDGIFEILNKDSGTEQHRHHAVEVSLYNILAMLYEIESGTPYRMRKAHDLYSGLGGIDDIFGSKESSGDIGGVDDDDGDGAVQSVVDKDKAESKSKLSSIDEEVEEESELEEENEEEGGDGDKPNVDGVIKKKKVRNIMAVMTDDANLSVPKVGAAVLTQAQIDAQRAQQAQLDREHEALVLDQMLRRAENIVDTLDGVKIYPVTGTTVKECLCNTGSNVYTGPLGVDASGQTIAHIPSVKSKFAGKFDVVFVSSRVGQVVAEPYFQQLLRHTADNTAASSNGTTAGIDMSLPTTPSVADATAVTTTPHPPLPPHSDRAAGVDRSNNAKKRGCISGGSIVCIETSKYLVPLTNDEKEMFDCKIHHYATGTDIMSDRLKKKIADARDEDENDAAVGAVGDNQSSATPCQHFTALQASNYPINRRRRDETDTTNDVAFFTTGTI